MTIEKGLLIHWWHYYSKKVYTLAELKKFKEIIDEYGPKRVWDIITASFVGSDGSPSAILECIREHIVEDMFNTLPKFDNTTGPMKKFWRKEKEKVIQKLLATYKLYK